MHTHSRGSPRCPGVRHAENILQPQLLLLFLLLLLLPTGSRQCTKADILSTSRTPPPALSSPSPSAASTSAAFTSPSATSTPNSTASSHTASPSPSRPRRTTTLVPLAHECTTISLRRNALTPREVEVLAGLVRDSSSLVELDLWAARIGDDGARLLALALAKNRHGTVRTLNLWDNNIRGDGMMALAAALSSGGARSVRRFNIGGNLIGEDGARALAWALEQQAMGHGGHGAEGRAQEGGTV